MAQNWTNGDGLFIQYGTDQTTSEVAGEFALPGAPNRIVEFTISLSTLSTSTASIISNNLIFPAPPSGQLYIEKVEMVVETVAGSSGSGTLNVGLIQMDRATVPSNYGHALINTETTAHMTAGTIITYLEGVGQAGTLIGSAPANATGPYYLTAQAGTAVFQSGFIRIRVYYHGIGTITQ